MSAAKKNESPPLAKRDQEILKQAEAIETTVISKRGFFYASEQRKYERKIDLYRRDSFMLLVR